MSPLPPERWTEANRIFHNALAYPADTRMTYVDQVCRDDGALRDEVCALLAYHERADSMGAPLTDAAAPAPLDLPFDPTDQSQAVDHTDASSVDAPASVPVSTMPPAVEGGLFTAVWWWQTTQLLMMIGYGAAAYLLWLLAQTTGAPTDQWWFLGGLGAAMLANILRGRLWLTSLLEADLWRTTRMDVWPGLRLADGVFGMILLTTGAMQRLAYPPLGMALLTSCALVLVLFLLVEPALGRAIK